MAAKLDKKLCLNDPRFTYTGKESSPRGLGYCADAEEIGARREGRDKTMWMVILKNGVPVWTRVPTELLEETPPSPAATKKATTAAKKAAAAAATAAAAGFDPSAPSTSKAAEEAGATAEAAATTTAAKKRAPAKKKTPAATVAAPLAEEAPGSTEPPTPPPPPVAAKAAPKKAPAIETVPTTTAAVPAAKKPPTDFNVYMQYRMNQLATEQPELTNKERFSKSAKDWAALSPDEKKTEATAAHAYVAAKTLAAT